MINKNLEECAKVRKSIMIPMTLIFFFVITIGVIKPNILYNIENNIVTWATKSFGWLFQLSAVFFLIICLWIMFSKYGSIKLGGKDAQPTMSYWNWFCISLTAGIGTGILFWGIAEPITHFMNPPESMGILPGSESAAMFAMNTSFTHWTFYPYSMYAISGVCIAFAIYNMKLPCRVSSVLYPLFNKKVNYKLESLIDNICLFAMAGGVAAILGVGTMQISKGLNIILGVPNNKFTWIIIVTIIVITYIISSITGIDKGIKWISDKNTKLFIGLMVFIFVLGPTSFILSLGTQALGNFASNFLQISTYLSPIDGSDWPRWWPIYYWAIWLAYAPLNGMFFAMISKGRTIREFMVMNLIIPALFGMIWFIIFGGAAIHQELSYGDLWSSIQSSGMEVSLFAFLTKYPFVKILSIFFILAIFISIVTMCDSVTTTITKLSIKSDKNEKTKTSYKINIFWGVLMASMAIVNLICAGGKISGIDATKQIATVAGFPILFFMIALAFCLVKMLVNHKLYDKTDEYEPESYVLKTTKYEGEDINKTEVDAMSCGLSRNHSIRDNNKSE
ncbi:BCCT transporter family protein [[Clostridium] bifermentans ATCC 638]|uniref:BCCT transporter family protein n=1 Tax=Paraclostridium bifermentans ATCC 638 = DSM 14991 TaxID=1233171 RepID=T4VNE4_PARBF|nr:BCCT family transporter [Paraclostridium bifermentans]EQK42640.1 BCCT transporter family protein [[Clostridium] bifermentans ATCC 638] [Paraclostridium bifermentans ATCC 638 = DSM 14991]RIZ60142.1 BCCT family transporter [Paraclostridium bifermentans]UAG19445.1 BCCT family transporter [Paraclostridium bifermentans]